MIANASHVRIATESPSPAQPSPALSYSYDSHPSTVCSGFADGWIRAARFGR